jgi:uncharacterized membrane protein
LTARRRKKGKAVQKAAPGPQDAHPELGSLQPSGGGQSGSVTEVNFQQTTGPIPPPGMLADYDKVVMDGAERIVRMAETQSTHRQRTEWAEIVNERWGMGLGFVTLLLFLAAMIWLIIGGFELAGTIGLLMELVAVAFIRLLGVRQPGAESGKEHD